LLRRRAAGEPLRSLASDYGVAHTTLGDYFARPEVAREVRELARLLRAEQRAGRRWEREQEQQVRRQAREQAQREREWDRVVAAGRAELSRRQARGWRLTRADERLIERPATRKEMHSQSDEIAAGVVASGGGIDAIVEATDSRTRANVYATIDPAVLVRAFRNEAVLLAAAEPERGRLRQLVPDPELIRRRAAGESLRRLARDYRGAHTTLGRYFRRPAVTAQLDAAGRQRRRRSARPR